MGQCHSGLHLIATLLAFCSVGFFLMPHANCQTNPVIPLETLWREHAQNKLMNQNLSSLEDGALTIPCLKVSEAELRALVGDQELSIQGENHGFVLHIDHATDHIALFPWMSKVAAPCMHTSTLKQKKTNIYIYYQDTIASVKLSCTS